MNWPHTQMVLLDAARDVVSFATNWLLQSSLLIAAGVAVARLLRFRGSALQSAIYRTTLAAVVVCPLATSLMAGSGLSGWSVKLPVAWTYEQLTAARSGKSELPGMAASTAPMTFDPVADKPPVESFLVSVNAAESRIPSGVEPPVNGLPNGRASIASLSPPAGIRARALSDATPSTRTASSAFQVRAFGFAALGITLSWLAVSAAMLLRLALAWRRLNQLLGETATAEPAAQQACRELAVLLNVAAPEVLRTSHLTSPCLAGLLRPAVLLPEAEPPLPLRDVLIHELAHLRRRDGVWNLLARLAEALFFYQPLLWMLSRRLEAAAEEVCDDYVVQFGGDRMEYARGLLEIAELSSVPIGAGAVAMVSLRSILARRVARIIDSSRRLSTRAGNFLLAAVIAGGLVGTIAVSFLGLGSQPSLAEAHSASDEAKVEASDLQVGHVANAEGNRRASDALEKVTEQAGNADPVPDKSLRGHVIRADGKPVAVVVADVAGSTDDSNKGAAARSVKAKIVRGRVNHGGQPASGAHVAVIGRRISVTRSGDLRPNGEILAETAANANGEYVLSLMGVSQKTHADAKVIARQDGFGMAWRQLNLDAPETEAAIELPSEEPIRGRLIGLEGQPAAGVRMSIAAVVERNENETGESSVGYQGDKIPAAWLTAVTSDDQGRFLVQGVAAGAGVLLEVEGSDRFAPQDIALNTGWAEQRGERDATYRSLVKNVKPGEEAAVALSPAQLFEGVVRYADSGQPAPYARITIWASQQEYGSMMLIAGSADENGHYRINPRPGIRFGLTAYPPEGVAYLGRQTPPGDSLRWAARERIKHVDLTLPRGVLVRGRIVEAGSETPVAQAAIQYAPESSNNPNASHDILTRWAGIQLSDQEGRFSIAVLPGPGRLMVNSQQGNYVLQEIGDRELYQGKPGGWRNYAHAIAKLNPQAGQDALEVKMEVQPGATVMGRIVDEQGAQVDEVLVVSRLHISPHSPFWRGHTTPTLGGRFELAGLAHDVEYPTYFLDAKRQLGATEIIKAGDGERTVVLKPCGKAKLRLIDDNRKPLSGENATVEMVVTPGASRYDRDATERGELAADADYLANIDRTNHWHSAKSDEQGQLTLPALIPGASYRITAARGGRLQVVNEFQVKASETLDLGDIVVERGP
jgi:beta-lactamase regulating signal transducer with metallopeptidase domain